MNVIKADVLGFCMGVRQAVSKTLEEAEKANGSKVYTFGSLVHNPRVLEDLKKNGIETLTDLESDLKDATVIIRAHGISPAQEDALREKGAKIVDATCLKVKKSQNKARELARAGYSVFLAGETHHAEIEGILGYAKESLDTDAFCITVGNAEEAANVAEQICRTPAFSACRDPKTALLGQTTISEEEYYAIAETIKEKIPFLDVINTICSATKDRQRALRNLFDKVDAIIIAGGKESANTRRLLAIAEESGKPCVLVESAAEIPPEFFKYKTIGLSAGASTPDCVIEEIEQRLGA